VVFFTGKGNACSARTILRARARACERACVRACVRARAERESKREQKLERRRRTGLISCALCLCQGTGEWGEMTHPLSDPELALYDHDYDVEFLASHRRLSDSVYIETQTTEKDADVIIVSGDDDDDDDGDNTVVTVTDAPALQRQRISPCRSLHVEDDPQRALKLLPPTEKSDTELIEICSVSATRGLKFKGRNARRRSLKFESLEGKNRCSGAHHGDGDATAGAAGGTLTSAPLPPSYAAPLDVHRPLPMKDIKASIFSGRMTARDVGELVRDRRRCM
jgi:hypothetical protein